MPIAILVVLWAAPVVAQVVPAGYELRHALWVGGECSSFSASFPYQSGQRISGCGAFADARWAVNLDVEGDARWLAFGGFAGSTESSYLVGPRYIFSRLDRFQPYGKFLVGVGDIHFPYQIGNGRYFALAPGAGVNYRLARRLTVRADYEYQVWMNSPGFANEPNHPLMPNGVSVGVAYQLMHF